MYSFIRIGKRITDALLESIRNPVADISKVELLVSHLRPLIPVLFLRYVPDIRTGPSHPVKSGDEMDTFFPSPSHVPLLEEYMSVILH